MTDLAIVAAGPVRLASAPGATAGTDRAAAEPAGGDFERILQRSAGKGRPHGAGRDGETGHGRRRTTSDRSSSADTGTGTRPGAAASSAASRTDPPPGEEASDPTEATDTGPAATAGQPVTEPVTTAAPDLTATLALQAPAPAEGEVASLTATTPDVVAAVDPAPTPVNGSTAAPDAAITTTGGPAAAPHAHAAAAPIPQLDPSTSSHTGLAEPIAIPTRTLAATTDPSGAVPGDAPATTGAASIPEGPDGLLPPGAPAPVPTAPATAAVAAGSHLPTDAAAPPDTNPAASDGIELTAAAGLDPAGATLAAAPAPAPAAPAPSAPAPAPVTAQPGTLPGGEPSAAWEQVHKALGTLRRLGDGTQQVRVRLHPEELGEVLVEVTTHAGQVRINLVTETVVARERLGAELSQLAAKLGESGLEASALDVSTRQRGGQASDDQGSGRAGPERGHRAERSVAIDLGAHAVRRPAGSGAGRLDLSL